MYVTLVQNISASMRSVSSLCDSLKHLNLHQIDPFLSQNLPITCYSTLYEKWTLFICIYPYEINTGPVPIQLALTRDGHWSLCLVTHPAQMNLSTMLSHMRIYLTHCKELIQYTHKFLSFILNKDKINLTIKGHITLPSLLGNETQDWLAQNIWFKMLGTHTKSNTNQKSIQISRRNICGLLRQLKGIQNLDTKDKHCLESQRRYFWWVQSYWKSHNTVRATSASCSTLKQQARYRGSKENL